MQRVRNTVVIIILCIIGAMSFHKKAPQLAMPTQDEIKDAVAGNPSHPRRHAPLTLASGHTDDLRDSVAGNAVGTPNDTNSLDDIGGPPRGSGNGGFGPLAANNNNPPSDPPVLSPSGPQDEPSNPCQGYGPSAIKSNCY